MNEISAFGIIHKVDKAQATQHVLDYNGTRQGRKDFRDALKYQRKSRAAAAKGQTANAGPGLITGVTAAGALAGGALGATTPGGNAPSKAKLAGAGAALGGAATGGYMLYRKANKKRYRRDVKRYADKSAETQKKYYEGLFAHKSEQFPKGVPQNQRYKKKQKVIHKSFIPGVGYVPAVKAGKETLKRAAKIRQSPSHNRPGPTASDRADKEKIMAAVNQTPKGTPHLADQIRQGTIASGQKPLHQYTPKEIADKGSQAEDINRTKKALKRLYGKKGDKGVVLSPANGPVEQATKLGPYSNVSARTISAGQGFKSGAGTVRNARLAFRQPGGWQQSLQTKMLDKQKKEVERQVKWGQGTRGHAWLVQDATKVGHPGKMPGGKFAPKKDNPPATNDADEVARHEAVHQSQGKAKLRRKLRAGHITPRQYDLALMSRAVRHNRKAGGKGPSYSTKEEARADAITRQTADTPEGKKFISGHDHEEGFVDAHNKVVQGLNRTEKKRRKQGRGRNDFVKKVPYAGG